MDTRTFVAMTAGAMLLAGGPVVARQTGSGATGSAQNGQTGQAGQATPGGGSKAEALSRSGATS